MDSLPSSSSEAALVIQSDSRASFVFTIDTARNRFMINRVPVRYIVSSADQVWVMAQNIAEVMEYFHGRDAFIAKIAAQDKKTSEELQQDCKFCPADPIPPNTVFISQEGLLSLLMASTKPFAKQFQGWVENNLLPAIQGVNQLQRSQGQEIQRLKNVLKAREPEAPGDRPQINLVFKDKRDDRLQYYMICGQARHMNAGLKRLKKKAPRAEVIYEIKNIYNVTLFRKRMIKVLKIQTNRYDFDTQLSREQLIVKVQELEQAVSLKPLIQTTITRYFQPVSGALAP